MAILLLGLPVFILYSFGQGVTWFPVGPLLVRFQPFHILPRPLFPGGHSFPLRLLYYWAPFLTQPGISVIIVVRQFFPISSSQKPYSTFHPLFFLRLSLLSGFFGKFLPLLPFLKKPKLATQGNPLSFPQFYQNFPIFLISLLFQNWDRRNWRPLWEGVRRNLIW